MDPWKDSVQQLWGQTGMWQYKCAELVRLNDKKSVHFQFSRCRIWTTIFVAFSFSERVMPAQGLSKPSQSRIIWFLVYFNENIAVASEWETLPPRTHFGNVWKLWSESHLLVSDCLWPHGLYSPWNSPGQNTGVGSYSLLQGIFPTQGLYPGLLHCRKILYQLSHQGSPRILEWVVYPFSSGSSQPRIQTGDSCVVGGFFTSWAASGSFELPWLWGWDTMGIDRVESVLQRGALQALQNCPTSQVTF